MKIYVNMTKNNQGNVDAKARSRRLEKRNIITIIPPKIEKPTTATWLMMLSSLVSRGTFLQK